MGIWTSFRPAVFFLTFASYALFHVVRKTLSFVKATIVIEWTPSQTSDAPSFPRQVWNRESLFQNSENAGTFLGILNATFLFVYAVGLYLSGMIADRMDLRIFLSMGMILSATVGFVFGPVLEWSGNYSLAAYVSLMVLNGLLQSTGWPCVVAVMSNWFGRGSRGFVLGVWSASPSVGSIIGAFVASTVVNYGYEYAFMLSSSLLFAGGVVVFFGLVSSPLEAGLPMPDDIDTDAGRGVGSFSDASSDLCKQGGRRRKSVPNLLYSPGWVTFDIVSFENIDSNTIADPTDEKSTRRKSMPHNFNGSLWNVSETNAYKTDLDSLKRRFSLASPSTKKWSATPGNGRYSKDTLILLNKTYDSDIGTGYDNITTAEDLYFTDEQKTTELNNIPGYVKYVPEDKLSGDSLTEITVEANGHSALKKRNSYAKASFNARESEIKGVKRKLRLHSETSAEATADNPSALAKSEAVPDTNAASSSHDDIPNSSSSRPTAISFFRAVLLPGVIPYSLAYAFLKLVNYVFFFWLPLYLSSSFGWSQSVADQLSVWYDVGGVVGGTVAGVLGNRFNKRALVVTPMLVMGIPMLYLYGSLTAGQNKVVNAVMLVVLGSFIGGVANIISAAISADLGRQESIRGNVEALSTVAGIIEGTGTMGAALGQVVVPYLSSAFGWRSVFYLLMAAIFLTVVNILPITKAEIEEAVKTQKTGKAMKK